MAKTFAIINNKGGTGKTTTVANLGAALARLGRRVLLVDLDSQCNLSSHLGVEAPDDRHAGTFLLGKCPADKALVPVENLFLLPSSDKLLDYENQVNNEPGREFLLAEALEPLKSQFDFILLDCPPSLGALSVNALVAADFYIVPMQAENFAYIGLDKILAIAEKVRKRMNPRLELAGILFVKQSMRTRFSQAVLNNLDRDPQLANKRYQTLIAQDIKLMESSSLRQTIFEYDSKSRGAVQYLELAQEILQKHG